VRCGSLVVEQEYTLLVLVNYSPVPTEALRIHNYGAPLSENTFNVIAGPLRVSVRSPALCEITPYRYRSFKSGVAATQYEIDVVHPK
jgi:hypothetical protein